MVVTLRPDGRRYSRHVLTTPRWQALRHVILERDGWACRACGTRRGRLEVDHIRSVRTGGAPYDPANLQTLCSRCHTRKTAQEITGTTPSPARQAWADLLQDMQRNPVSSKGKSDAQ